MQYKIKIINSDGSVKIHPTRFLYQDACSFLETMEKQPNTQYSIIAFSSTWDAAIKEGLFPSENEVDRYLERVLKD